MSTEPGSGDARSQAELLHDLQYGSPEQQKGTLKRLADIGEAEALDAIIDYLLDQPPDVRGGGLDTLRVLANKFMPGDRYRLAEVLMPMLEGDEWSHRLVAARLLSTHPNELAVETLRNLIEEAHERVLAEQRRRFSPARVVAERTLAESILALANCGGLTVLPDILEILEDPSLRAIATRALGIIGSDTERMRLEDLIEDDDVNVRDAAQWALALMDERQAQFMMPPDQQPEPPPDRLSPVYWMHRQLEASDDALLQFLIVRVAIEHLLLDTFISEGRVPEECRITLRRYEGQEPPDFKTNRAEVVGVWKYRWAGPELEAVATPSLPQPPHPGLPRGRGTSITISYPATLPDVEDGLVSFDCLFGPFYGRGWIYRITRQDGTWAFSLVRRTWTS